MGAASSFGIAPARHVGGGIWNGSEARAAIVTGGTSGIGEACVRRLAQGGAGVIFCGGDADAGELKEQMFRAESLDNVHFRHADVSCEEDVAALADATRDQILSLNAMHRIGRPEEVADAAFWLCGAEAGFITGAVVPVDGGFSVK